MAWIGLRQKCQKIIIKFLFEENFDNLIIRPQCWMNGH